MKTPPILFIIFNRPDITRQVFAEIKKIRPEKFFVAADGPRPNKPEDIKNCQLARDVIQGINWPCEVKTLFRDKNLGCKTGISEAITWFFSHVESGIILEDDCLADQSFFPYCSELLEKYKDDRRIMHISGDNFQQNNPDFHCPDSYYFSRIPQCWGWATWKRAWDLYDIDITLWPQLKAQKKLYRVFKDGAIADRWEYLFDQGIKDHTDPLPQARLDWDGRWKFSCFAHDGLCIVPCQNLVSNIGFGSDARIARNPNDPLANIPAQSIELPLKHPQKVEVNLNADIYINKYIYGINRYWSQRIQWFFKSNLPGVYSYMRRLYRSKK